MFNRFILIFCLFFFTSSNAFSYYNQSEQKQAKDGSFNATVPPTSVLCFANTEMFEQHFSDFSVVLAGKFINNKNEPAGIYFIYTNPKTSEFMVAMFFEDSKTICRMAQTIEGFRFNPEILNQIPRYKN